MAFYVDFVSWILLDAVMLIHSNEVMCACDWPFGQDNVNKTRCPLGYR